MPPSSRAWPTGRAAGHASPSQQRSRTLVRASGRSRTNLASQDVTGRVERLQRLPRVTFSYDRYQMDAAQLADLLSQVACFAPGQIFHCQPPLPGGNSLSNSGRRSSSKDAFAAGSGGSSSNLDFLAASSSSSRSSNSSLDFFAAGSGGSSSNLDFFASSSSGSSSGSSTTSSSSSDRRVLHLDPVRLQGAIQRSLVCVAAYVEERYLPPWQHLAARGLLTPQQQQRRRSSSGQRRVLVGFARAVGDGALVATVHDVAVLPELRGLGLGRQLLERLLRQLDILEIVDIGLLAPDSAHGFFSACSFGPDSEGSTVMTLSQQGTSSRAGLPLEGMGVHVKRQLVTAAVSNSALSL